ncbi:S1C family serine protease [Candidatus Cyanaurora vandensis]|uniref:S1C family serine protease n=1 Tax=Candidatus Cyanaurora vandensis TaxID=2714958 RepID=UPI00257EE4C6|nr:trypsin-like peptidase domain-containing protein [Candidatus Cyanaurora vandensis]
MTSELLIAFSDQLAATVAKAGQWVVGVDARQRHTVSGMSWQAGVVVTAHHALRRDEDLTLILPTGGTAPATLVGRDPSTDLAVLRLDQTLPLPGFAPAAQVGQIVLALGRNEEGVSTSLGVVSALSGGWRTWRGGKIDQFLRPDLNLYPGFSGGPLVDSQGGLLGMNTAGLSRNLGLTIPVVTIRRVVGQLLSQGRVTRGYLGIGMQPVRLPENLRASLDLSGGVIVVNVEPGSPADQGGILLGDVLVRLAGTAVADPGDVLGLLGAEQVGQTVVAQVIRGGQLTELTISVGERPQRGG